MTILKINGQTIDFDSEGRITINGRLPEMVDLGSNFFKVIAYLYRYKKPKAVVGARKRKKALKCSIKKYRFSFNIKKEK